MRARPVALSALLILATVAAGLTIRLTPLGLPDGVVKYGGSALWAMMIYWIVSTARPRWSPVRSALASSAIALCVELFKLYHTPQLDAFRLTLPGKLLLGRVFSLWDLLAYTLAIIAGMLAHHAIRAQLGSRLPAPRERDLRTGRKGPECFPEPDLGSGAFVIFLGVAAGPRFFNGYAADRAADACP